MPGTTGVGPKSNMQCCDSLLSDLLVSNAFQDKNMPTALVASVASPKFADLFRCRFSVFPLLKKAGKGGFGVTGGEKSPFALFWKLAPLGNSVRSRWIAAKLAN
jgi:hypothetical protein